MTFIKGQSGNPNGRPAGEESVAAKFRSNPKIDIILSQILAVAETLGTPDQHANAWVAAKLVVEKTIPSLRPQDYENTDLKFAIAQLMERIDREAMEAYEKAMTSNKQLEEWEGKNQEPLEKEAETLDARTRHEHLPKDSEG